MDPMGFDLARRGAGPLLATLLALPSALTFAQSPAPAVQPCRGAEHRQFDFWIGQWDVYLPDGRKAGENIIEPIAGGCALLEHWAGRGGVSGKSLNIYDSADRRWHQTWVDNGGGLLMLSGGWVGDRIVLATQAANPDATGAVVEQRISWTPGADGAVRQLWESSSDSGKTWTVLFDGRYVKQK